jgi:hypothetical protein
MLKKPRQQGQAMAEYCIVCALGVIVMFVPSSLTNGQSMSVFLFNAMKSFYQAFSYLLSLS